MKETIHEWIYGAAAWVGLLRFPRDINPAKLHPSAAVSIETNFLGRKALESVARTLADDHRHLAPSFIRSGLSRRASQTSDLLREAVETWTHAGQQGKELPLIAPAVLDNFYIMNRELTQVGALYSRGFDKTLEKSNHPELGPVPRVYQVAETLLSASDGRVHMERLDWVLDAYQNTLVLRLGELWAIPLMLRFAELELVRRVVYRALALRGKRAEVSAFLQSVLGEAPAPGAAAVLKIARFLEDRPGTNDEALIDILLGIRRRGFSDSIVGRWLETLATERGVQVDDALAARHREDTHQQEIIRNAIDGLRLIENTDWAKWIERHSRVHAILTRDPAKVYSECDFETRERYRRSVEKIARASKFPEVVVAERLVSMAERAVAAKGGPPDPELYERPIDHVGYYLCGPGSRELRSVLPLGPKPLMLDSASLNRDLCMHLYLGAVLVISVLTSFAGLAVFRAFGTSTWVCAVIGCLLLFPCSELAVGIVQWLTARVVKPERLLRFEYENGVPHEFRTLVVLHTILNDQKALEQTIDKLEVRYLGNQDPNIRFLLFADLPDSATATARNDTFLVRHMERLVRNLNERYAGSESEPPPFMCCFRHRKWNERQGKFICWERKRGKLDELNRIILDEHAETTVEMTVGTIDEIRRTRLVITLDEDTELAPRSARRLIATLSHPVNRPVFDAANMVVEGYSILQPRVSTNYDSARISIFTRLFAGRVGLDPYTHAVSEFYQDVFGEGIYTGKGIYDVRAFARALEGRVPENSLLSHDLFEGLYARVGFVSDIELLDSMPAKFMSYAKRWHRWVRGDWQLLPWLAPAVPTERGGAASNPLHLLAAWKLVDNLRRSLVLPAVFLLLGIVILDRSTPLMVLPTLFLALLLIPSGILSLNYLLGFSRNLVLAPYLGGWIRDLLALLGRFVVTTVALPYLAFKLLHAAVLTIARVFFTRKNMLEWQSASLVERAALSRRGALVNEMLPATIITLALTAMVAVFNPQNLISAAPLLTAWLLAPFLLLRLEEPFSEVRAQVSKSDREYLIDIARDTWSFFDEFVNESTHYLAPDNHQVYSRKGLAMRTSPTNIGLSILAPFSAEALGFVPIPRVLEYLDRTVSAMEDLPRFRGHLFNWYDISNVEPLLPRYISTVDSGNLVGHLLTAAQALLEQRRRPLMGPAHREWLVRILNGSYIRGRANSPEVAQALDILQSSKPLTLDHILTLTDHVAKVVDMLAASLDESAAGRRTLRDLQAVVELRRLVGWVRDIRGFMDEALRVLGLGFDATAVASEREQIQRITRLLERGDVTPHMMESVLRRLEVVGQRRIPRLFARLRGATPDTQELYRRWEKVRQAAEQSLKLLKLGVQLSQRMRDFAFDHDFEFLYDYKQHLFAIGFQVDTDQLDQSRYDLLASECRLGSFMAIAKGDVPSKHWFHLGRSLAATSAGRLLVSWGGTMFEYFMPLLVMRHNPWTLLGETCERVVSVQMDYAKRNGFPWGISESAYSLTDQGQIYQYQTFGVPGLGLRSGLAEDVVISPYSTILAATLRPDAAIPNLRAIEKLGGRGDYGFYEAIDFTQGRLLRLEGHRVIKAFFAHHQGMSLAALTNILAKDYFPNIFHSIPEVAAHDMLLHERVPERVVPLRQVDISPAYVGGDRAAAEADVFHPRYISTPYTQHPFYWSLGNGEMSSLLEVGGGGVIRANRGDTVLTRWEEDPTSPSKGLTVFVRNNTSNAFWSAGFQPSLREPNDYFVKCDLGTVSYRRRDDAVSTVMEVCVSPTDPVELRRVHVRNLTETAREIDIFSYFEVALASYEADRSHPAFSKLFVEVEYDPALCCCIAIRRSREHDGESKFVFHAVLETEAGSVVGAEGSREKFIGRARDLWWPEVLTEGGSLTGTFGQTLDPIMSFQVRSQLEGHKECHITYISGVAESRDAIRTLLQRYRERSFSESVFNLAEADARAELQRLEVPAPYVHFFQGLATALTTNLPFCRTPEHVIRMCREGQSALWKFGISGDLPILLIEEMTGPEMRFFRELLVARQYLLHRGIKFDIAILVDETSGYLREVQDQFRQLARGLQAEKLIGEKGGIFILSKPGMSPDEMRVLRTSANVVMGSAWPDFAPLVRPAPRSARPVGSSPYTLWRSSLIGRDVPRVGGDGLSQFNGIGGFDKDGSYVMRLSKDTFPPRPWSNVIAQPEGGCLVTDSGGGYSWFRNSREFRLSPWDNDPLIDRPGEVVYVRDSSSGRVWNAGYRPVPSAKSSEVRHGFGISELSSESEECATKLSHWVGTDSSMRVWEVELENKSSLPRTLELYLYVEVVLGDRRDRTYRAILSSYDVASEALCFENVASRDFRREMVYFGSDAPVTGYTGSRMEFLGRHGTVAQPHALEPLAALKQRDLSRTATWVVPRVKLSGLCGAVSDPAAVLSVSVKLAPGEKQRVHFVAGTASNRAEVRSIVRQLRQPESFATEKAKIGQHWNPLVKQVEISTPDPRLDRLMNGWLMYQTLASRLWGRTGYYQSSGAFGFRDQLQDSLALLHAAPQMTRQQILLHASRQFPEGDVQHWWHMPSGRGIRTRISDNYLWLPYAVGRYIEHTGDWSILDEAATLLQGPQLEPDEHEKYFEPELLALQVSIYRHCSAAMQRALRFGERGLPFMGCGDWNDGMNRVGLKGKGESVWLGMFLYEVIEKFAPMVERMADTALLEQMRAAQASLKRAVNEKAWDGAWFIRAFGDDGDVIGSRTEKECKIDSLAQSWAAITGITTKEREDKALDSAIEHLMPKDSRILRLLTPPFHERHPSPGYIQAYPRGIRENGGQYTHASTWLIWALAKSGRAGALKDALEYINPVTHTESREQVAVYGAEPYVLCGDVYSEPPFAGRGGWSWYTGSSGWLFQVILESVFGVKRRGDHLVFEPSLPEGWPTASLRYAVSPSIKLDIEYRREGSGAVEVELNGEKLGSGGISIHELKEGEHRVQVRVPSVHR